MVDLTHLSKSQNTHAQGTVSRTQIFHGPLLHTIIYREKGPNLSKATSMNFAAYPVPPAAPGSRSPRIMACEPKEPSALPTKQTTLPSRSFFSCAIAAESRILTQSSPCRPQRITTHLAQSLLHRSFSRTPALHNIAVTSSSSELVCSQTLRPFHWLCFIGCF